LTSPSQINPLLCSDDGGFPRNSGTYIPDYTALHLQNYSRENLRPQRRIQCSPSSPVPLIFALMSSSHLRLRFLNCLFRFLNYSFVGITSTCPCHLVLFGLITITIFCLLKNTNYEIPHYTVILLGPFSLSLVQIFYSALSLCSSVMP
jgi:hypothetical protein